MQNFMPSLEIIAVIIFIIMIVINIDIVTTIIITYIITYLQPISQKLVNFFNHPGRLAPKLTGTEAYRLLSSPRRPRSRS